jgi:hypothetical protein
MLGNILQPRARVFGLESRYAAPHPPRRVDAQFRQILGEERRGGADDAALKDY